MVLGFVCEGDFKLVAKAIRDRVTNIKRHREKLRRVAEEQSRQLGRRRKDEEEQQQQQQLLQAALEEDRSLEGSPAPPCRTPTPCQTSPAEGGSADSGLAAAAAAAEAEEPEPDQLVHSRHNSCSSANCEPRMIYP